MKAKITKKIVDALTLPANGSEFLWDSELTGFGIKLTPTGMTYIVQGRIKGISRRVSLGKHGVITPDKARDKAQKELAKMLEGVDPSIEKKKIKAYGKTLRGIVEDYIRDRRDLKESSKADIYKHVNKSFSDWADRPAIEVTRDKVAVRFRELSEKSHAQANQAFRVLRAILNYARGAYRPDNKPILIENPVRILSETKVWNRVQARSGRIPTDKIGIVWNLLQGIRVNDFETVISHTLADAISFLLLTGARWGEMASLTWDQVNLDESWWHLPDPKNRNSVTFPLSRVAADILKERFKKNPKSKYIFPARTGDGYVHDARGHFEKISGAVGAPVTAHDMRRTFRAIAGECNIELWKAKLLMNHKISQDVTISHYTETQDLRYLSAEINKISDWIVRQGKIAANGKVVPFPSRAVNGGK